GRVHYENWMVVGAPSRDVAAGYRSGVRTELRTGGTAWFIGAAGPLGRQHLAKAGGVGKGARPGLATHISTPPPQHPGRGVGAHAARRKVEFGSLNPAEAGAEAAAEEVRALTGGKGFDDVVCLVPAPPLIAEGFRALAPGGTLNVFAGVARGVKVPIDLSACYDERQARITGTSGSSIADMEEMLADAEAGRLSTDPAVAAGGGRAGGRGGSRGGEEGRSPGRVVLSPRVRAPPLTPLEALARRDARASEALRSGEWNRDAEKALLSHATMGEVARTGDLAGKTA